MENIPFMKKFFTSEKEKLQNELKNLTPISFKCEMISSNTFRISINPKKLTAHFRPDIPIILSDGKVRYKAIVLSLEDDLIMFKGYKIENRINMVTIDNGMGRITKILKSLAYAEEHEIYIHPEIENVLKSMGKIESETNNYTMSNKNNKLSIEFFDVTTSTTNLNQSQCEAINFIKNSSSYKIHGPPGTGKTKTIISLLNQIIRSSLKILVTGPSNASIDNILCHFNGYSFVRLGSQIKTKFKNQNIKKDKTAKLTFATLYKASQETQEFDIVIIDECCMAKEIELILTLSKAKMFILAGDPFQIGENNRLFEKLDLKTFILDTQYRSTNDLISFSNSFFYNNQIKSQNIDCFKFFDNNSILFIDTASTEKGKFSKFNEIEAKIVKECLDKLCFSLTKNTTVLCPYNAQVEYLKSMIEGVRITTIDNFQGQEDDLIILSLVRSNMDSHIGFMNDLKRLNVAITRCKKGMIVIGDSLCHLKTVMAPFIRWMNENAMVLDSATFQTLLEEF